MWTRFEINTNPQAWAIPEPLQAFIQGRARSQRLSLGMHQLIAFRDIATGAVYFEFEGRVANEPHVLREAEVFVDRVVVIRKNIAETNARAGLYEQSENIGAEVETYDRSDEGGRIHRSQSMRVWAPTLDSAWLYHKELCAGVLRPIEAW